MTEAESALATAPSTPASHEDTSRNPFRSERFRWWWAATICGAMGVGIQVVTVPLFVRDRVAEDQRALAIAFALICQTVPAAILMLIGGVVADRVERQKILVRVYAIAAVASLAYVFISGLDVQAVWPVFVLGAVIGSVDAFGQPARISMAPQILPRAQVQNGIILGMVAFMASFQFLGPAVGGLLADGFSLTVAFSAEVLFLVVAAFLASRVGVDKPVPTGKNIRGDLADGINYVRRSTVIKALLFMQFLPGLLLIGPLRVTAVLMVEDVLEVSDKFVGLLSGAFGIGVLSGSILMTMVRLRRRGLILCSAPILGGVIFVAYGMSEEVGLSLALMIPWGWSAALFINMATPLLQERAEPAMLGRVMSVSNLAFAIATPIGLLQSGIIAATWGPQESIIVSGAVFALIGVACVLFLRPVRSLP